MTQVNRTQSRPLLLGHRGAKAYAPENSVAAFELCLAHGCDGFEFDVHLAHDGAVCCHDADWNGRAVREHTRDALQLAGLADALRFADRAFLDIELKECGIVSAEAQVLAALDPARTIITSFNPDALQEARQHAPSLPRGLICDASTSLSLLNSVYVDAVVLHRTLVTDDIQQWLHGMNKQLFVWTVNDAADMRQFARMGVDAIISDDTKLLASTLRAGAIAHASGDE